MKLSLFILTCFVASGLFFLETDARHIKRSAENTEAVCSRSTPCGWEVYRPYERTFVAFVDSPCSCPNDSRCARTSDDISISAYVHRCIPIGIEAGEWSYDSLEE